MYRRIFVIMLVGHFLVPVTSFSQAADSTVVDLPKLSDSLEETTLINGTISQQLGEHDKAIEQFLLGLEKNPSNTSLLLGLSESYLELEDFNSSDYYVGLARDIEPSNPILLAHQLQLSFSMQDYDQTRKLLAFAKDEGISSKDIENVQMLLVNRPNSRKKNLAELTKEDINKMSEEEKFFYGIDDDIKSTTNTRSDHSELSEGIDNFNKGEFTLAIEFFETAIKRDPKDINAWAFLVKSASSVPSKEAAKTYHAQADLLFPFNKRIGLANVYRLIADGQFDNAELALNKITLDSEIEEEFSQMKSRLTERQK